MTDREIVVAFAKSLVLSEDLPAGVTAESAGDALGRLMPGGRPAEVAVDVAEAGVRVRFYEDEAGRRSVSAKEIGDAEA